jgi:hypothetical protein
MKEITFVIALACATLTAAAQTTAAPDEVPREIRQHLSVVSPTGIDDYVVTQIQRFSEKGDKTVVLLRTSAGDRLIATHEWNYTTQVSYTEIRDERSSEFLRVTFTYPMVTRTRSDTLEQVKKNPLLLTGQTPFEMTAPGNSRLSGIASHWEDPETAKGWRIRLRQMLSPTFLEELEIVDSSGLLKEPIFSYVHDFLMNHVLYRTSCDSTASLRVAPAVPDCTFDKDFGFPCSMEQQARAKAAVEGKKPQRY